MQNICGNLNVVIAFSYMCVLPVVTTVAAARTWCSTTPTDTHFVDLAEIFDADNDYVAALNQLKQNRGWDDVIYATEICLDGGISI